MPRHACAHASGFWHMSAIFEGLCAPGHGCLPKGRSVLGGWRWSRGCVHRHSTHAEGPRVGTGVGAGAGVSWPTRHGDTENDSPLTPLTYSPSWYDVYD